jgi:hypothetical protein
MDVFGCLIVFAATRDAPARPLARQTPGPRPTAPSAAPPPPGDARPRPATPGPAANDDGMVKKLA